MPHNVIDDYLAELHALLPRSRARASVVAEIADGLTDSIDHHLADGLGYGEATLAAIAEMGDPRSMAAEFTAVISAEHINRYSSRFLLIGPTIGVAWILVFLFGSVDILSGIPAILGCALVLCIVTVAGSCAAVAAGATGPLSRWIDIGWHTAASAVLVTAFCAALIDAALIGFLLAKLGEPMSVSTMTLLLAAATGSGLRLCFAVTVLPRIARMRRTLLT